MTDVVRITCSIFIGVELVVRKRRALPGMELFETGSSYECFTALSYNNKTLFVIILSCVLKAVTTLQLGTLSCSGREQAHTICCLPNTPGDMKKSESDVLCSYHITATNKTRVSFTDLYSFLLLDNERSVESFGIQLPTISKTVELICTSAQDSTSHFEISRSPKAKEMSSPETVKTQKSENENVHGASTEGFEESSVCVSKQETVVVEESKAEEQKTTEDQGNDDSMFQSDYRFRLRLRVRYRINEEAIRCLLLLRWVGWVE